MPFRLDLLLTIYLKEHRLCRSAEVRVLPQRKMVGRDEECDQIRRLFQRVETDSDAVVETTSPALVRPNTGS